MRGRFSTPTAVAWCLLASACGGGTQPSPDGSTQGEATATPDEISNEVKGPGEKGPDTKALALRAGLPIPTPRRLVTRDGLYRVAWMPDGGFAPVNEYFELDVEVTTNPEDPEVSGEPVEGAVLEVSCDMPAHGHGMLRVPKSTDAGNGHYDVRGMLLHMSGHWVVTINVVANQVASTADDAIDIGFDEDVAEHFLTCSPVPPAPADPTNAWADDPTAAQLGQHVFFDTRFSKGNKTSCATCHDPRDSFVDLDPLATGVLPLERHTPSLWNVGHNRWFFWDGRADSLWAQALIPLESPLEHAFTRSEVVRVVHDDPVLRELYEQSFGELPPMDDRRRFPAWVRPVPYDDHAHQSAREHAAEASKDGRHEHAPRLGDPSGSDWVHPHQRAWDWMHPEDQRAVTRAFVNVGKAIAAYQRRLTSIRAPFDVFIEGLREDDASKVAALDEGAQRGMRLFFGRAQCFNCHNGPLFTDMEFHDTRVPGEPLDDPGRVRGIEELRASEFGVGSEWSDDPDGPARRKVDFLPVHFHAGREFKTPSLRNVALTPPYMHNGSLATLEAVVDFYADRTPLAPDTGGGERILDAPIELSPQDRADLVAFLHSLTDDEIDPALRSAPPRSAATDAPR